MSDAPMDPKKKTVLQLSVVILTMGTLAWASVPLYTIFCQVTGWGGADGFSPDHEVFSRITVWRIDE